MSDDVVNLEVDGKPVEGRRGQMIIEVTDSVGAYVPRFCYHKKLSVAANCRMCLVEVEKAPKPIPACATPIGEGMKIFTKSPIAISAQKATMEFLLINHPLDCPICDQGGECELQDIAIGYGRDVSRYNDGKRVVKDKDIGPLVSTDMTRCIHCTRCVRFGEEITALGKEMIDEGEVLAALSAFDPVWESLSIREQSRVIQLLVDRVEYDGEQETVTVTFLPSGLRALSREPAFVERDDAA